MARLVSNHTTFVEGLKPILNKLRQSQLISVIIPSRLGTTRTSLGKALELRVCVNSSGAHQSHSTSNQLCSGSTTGEVGDSISPSLSQSLSPFLTGLRTSHRVLARKGNQVQEVYFVTDDTAFARAYPSSSNQQRDNEQSNNNDRENTYSNAASELLGKGIGIGRGRGRRHNDADCNSGSCSSSRKAYTYAEADNSDSNGARCVSSVEKQVQFADHLNEMLAGVNCTVKVFPAKYNYSCGDCDIGSRNSAPRNMIDDDLAAAVLLRSSKRTKALLDKICT